MRKLTAVFAAFALTGLAACDSVQTGAAAPTTLPARAQQGEGGAAINPALLPAGAVTGAPTAGVGPQQGQGGAAINPATVPAERMQGGTPTAGTGSFQNSGPAVRTVQPPSR